MDSALFPPSLRPGLSSSDANDGGSVAFWLYERKQFGRGKFYGKIMAVPRQTSN